MASEIEVQTLLDGFDDPLLGYISFDRFEDPLLGLETMARLGQLSGQARSDADRNSLEATPDIEEIGNFLITYRRSNRLLETFHEPQPVTTGIRKREMDGSTLFELTFRPD
jgi:hypothetical protein